MHFSYSIVPLFAAVAVNAHFHLQFPPPRGPFVMNSEPTFCDGYTNVTTNRTIFPLDGGFIDLTSEHPNWSAEVFIAIDQNPNNASLFNVSSSGVMLPLAKQPFTETGEGEFCFPVDLGSLNIPGLQNGSNVTIQIEYNGGDGNLFQCADLTLISNATIPSNVSCSNATSSSNSSSNSTSSNSTSSGSGNTSGALPLYPIVTDFKLLTSFAGILGALAMIF